VLRIFWVARRESVALNSTSLNTHRRRDWLSHNHPPSFLLNWLGISIDNFHALAWCVSLLVHISRQKIERGATPPRQKGWEDINIDSSFLLLPLCVCVCVC
jgi:hypothetical protein